MRSIFLIVSALLLLLFIPIAVQSGYTLQACFVALGIIVLWGASWLAREARNCPPGQQLRAIGRGLAGFLLFVGVCILFIVVGVAAAHLVNGVR